MARAKIDKLYANEVAAKIILNEIAADNEQWANQVAICREELGCSDYQILGRWIAYILENDLHMQTPIAEQFMPGYHRKGDEFNCVRCNRKSLAVENGQRVCVPCLEKQPTEPGETDELPVEIDPANPDV